jgi:prepilin-type N-terminal cleavage/methylation domain-containing protein/prepilin-type processing-associated H-X9-DG protein
VEEWKKFEDMMFSTQRKGYSLIELLVVIAIMAILMALILPAVQKVRAAAASLQCRNNLKQLNLGLQNYHDTYASFPSARKPRASGDRSYRLSWITRILPFIDQEALEQKKQSELAMNVSPTTPAHTGLTYILPVVQCPADPNAGRTHEYAKRSYAFTNYLACVGTDSRSQDGIIFFNSAIKHTSITDGSSNTLLLGERPPSPEFRFGWWYTGIGQDGTGSLDNTLGTRAVNNSQWGAIYTQCPNGPYHFKPTDPLSFCSTFQNWSDHSGGANFAFADGSVRFMTYAVDSILPAYGTRNGQEVISD